MNPTYEITSCLFNKAISTVGQFLLKDKLNNIIYILKGLDADGNKFSNDYIEDYNFRVEGIR